MTLPNVLEHKTTPAQTQLPSPYLADHWEDAIRQELHCLLAQGGLLCITLPQYEKGYVSEKTRINALAQWASTEALNTINKNPQQEPTELLDFFRSVRGRTDEFKRLLQMKTLDLAHAIAASAYT
ncbi:uncharacterized protein ACA1_025850 [Acanthamoeba castellanii str. Neff]|uniref:Uncharacterized protein n=1 Tax=Acanthamoeba castellanii (strain ATCC 30010 / Neff) TaxID=1257118 RepID=L8HEW9_ACACF|nr:uncharacterized protein ACA1_025850 [Acanthamoeba castellanii str. Neff]ELR23782.1 hypothetical protein ACA1_025850 [Acanthamoeba castellanii str. Neff]